MRRRPRASLSRGGERLDGHHLRLGLAMVAATVAVSIVAVTAINGLPFGNPYRVRAVVPASAPIVRAGDEVHVAGQRVGEVRDVEPTAGGRLVTMDIDQGQVGHDASATVRLRGLAGAVYVDLNPGDVTDPAPSGSTIPRSRTSAGTQLTDVVAEFDRSTRKGLSRTLTAYGQGIAGRGDELNQAIADAPPTLEEGTPLLRALTPDPGVLADTMGGLDRTLAGLGGSEPGDVAGAIGDAASVFGTIAAHRSSLGQALALAPSTLVQARATLPLASPLLDDLTRASKALSPVVQRLGRALPDVNELLAREPELADLSQLAHAARPLLAAAGPTVVGLGPGAETLAPLARWAEPLAAYVARYPHEVFAGPHGFTTWGRFFYDEGQAPGHRAVRFTPIFTCAPGRDPYPQPGQVGQDRMPCPQ